MKCPILILLACVAAGAIGLGGCKDNTRTSFTPSELLNKQTKYWTECAESARKGKADLNRMNLLEGYLGGRTRIQMEKEYAKPNKEQAIALLKELAGDYHNNVTSLLQMTEAGPVLKPGVTNEDVCTAFLAMNDKYQKLVEMTK